MSEKKKLNIRELLLSLKPDSMVDLRLNDNAITSIYAREIQDELADTRRIAIRLGQIRLLALDNIYKAMQELVEFIHELDPIDSAKVVEKTSAALDA